jgi:hypothetical protein
MTMKTVFLSSLAALLFTIVASAQNHSVDRFFDRYADKDGFITVKFSNLPAGMFTDGEKDPDLRISSLRVLAVQDKTLNAQLNFYNDIVHGFNRAGYEELMSIKHKGDKSILLCKKDKKRITEILFVSGGENNVIVEITGSMTLEQAKNLTAQAANNKDENADDNGDD